MNKSFQRFVEKEGIDNATLFKTVKNAEEGLIDANLGGGVIKQRIARRGGGKFGGYRSIILYKSTSRAFFVFGFAKNDQENISQSELAALKSLAKELLNCADKDLDKLIITNRMREVR